MRFEPRLDILPPAQRRFWPRLASLPGEFVLYGGTAIALRLGHRRSRDFDFFSRKPFDPGRLLRELEILKGAATRQVAPNTLTVRLGSRPGFDVSFFGVPGLRRIATPDRTADIGIPVASLLDLAGTKAMVVQRRAEAKDYIDIDALIASGGVDLATMLAAARKLYGAGFAAVATLKALSFFRDGDLPDLSGDIRKRLLAAARSVDPHRLPRLRGRA